MSSSTGRPGTAPGARLRRRGSDRHRLAVAVASGAASPPHKQRRSAALAEAAHAGSNSSAAPKAARFLRPRRRPRTAGATVPPKSQSSAAEGSEAAAGGDADANEDPEVAARRRRLERRRAAEAARLLQQQRMEVTTHPCCVQANSVAAPLTPTSLYLVAQASKRAAARAQRQQVVRLLEADIRHDNAVRIQRQQARQALLQQQHGLDSTSDVSSTHSDANDSTQPVHSAGAGAGAGAGSAPAAASQQVPLKARKQPNTDASAATDTATTTHKPRVPRLSAKARAAERAAARGDASPLPQLKKRRSGAGARAGAGAGAGAGSEGLRKRTSSTGRDEAWVDPLANLRSTRNLTLQPTPGVLLEWNHLSYEVVTQGKRSYANDPTAQEIEPSKCKASCKRACGPLPCGMVHSNTRACVMLCIDKSL